jgi:hypothetical protein
MIKTIKTKWLAVLSVALFLILGAGLHQQALASAGNILDTIANESVLISTDNRTNLLLSMGIYDDSAKVQANSMEKTTLNDFITYGTPTTMKLGAGERAGLINSYFQAYKKMPVTQADWSDLLKIANGRWPATASVVALKQAKVEFKKVYGRNPIMTNTHDSNAVTIIAYGLLPAGRNIASEKVAIKAFEHFYGFAPSSALAWNVVRAIAYSGAAR